MFSLCKVVADDDDDVGDDVDDAEDEFGDCVGLVNCVDVPEPPLVSFCVEYGALCSLGRMNNDAELENLLQTTESNNCLPGSTEDSTIRFGFRFSPTPDRDEIALQPLGDSARTDVRQLPKILGETSHGNDLDKAGLAIDTTGLVIVLRISIERFVGIQKIS